MSEGESAQHGALRHSGGRGLDGHHHEQESVRVGAGPPVEDRAGLDHVPLALGLGRARVRIPVRQVEPVERVARGAGRPLDAVEVAVEEPRAVRVDVVGQRRDERVERQAPGGVRARWAGQVVLHGLQQRAPLSDAQEVLDERLSRCVGGSLDLAGGDGRQLLPALVRPLQELASRPCLGPTRAPEGGELPLADGIDSARARLDDPARQQRGLVQVHVLARDVEMIRQQLEGRARADEPVALRLAPGPWRGATAGTASPGWDAAGLERFETVVKAPTPNSPSRSRGRGMDTDPERSIYTSGGYEEGQAARTFATRATVSTL